MALLMHAMNATRPRTPSAAVACNVQLSAMRDFFVHEPPQSVTSVGLSLTREEFEDNREAAVAAIRAQCRLCGLCEKLGIVPP